LFNKVYSACGQKTGRLEKDPSNRLIQRRVVVLWLWQLPVLVHRVIPLTKQLSKMRKLGVSSDTFLNYTTIYATMNRWEWEAKGEAKGEAIVLRADWKSSSETMWSASLASFFCLPSSAFCQTPVNWMSKTILKLIQSYSILLVVCNTQYPAA
jgi:hypothetical protein